MKNLKKFGEALREIRISKELEYKDMLELGVTQSAIKSVEHGMNWQVETMVKYLDALNIAILSVNFKSGQFEYEEKVKFTPNKI